MPAFLECYDREAKKVITVNIAYISTIESDGDNAILTTRSGRELRVRGSRKVFSAELERKGATVVDVLAYVPTPLKHKKKTRQ